MRYHCIEGHAQARATILANSEKELSIAYALINIKMETIVSIL